MAWMRAGGPAHQPAVLAGPGAASTAAEAARAAPQPPLQNEVARLEAAEGALQVINAPLQHLPALFAPCLEQDERPAREAGVRSRSSQAADRTILRLGALHARCARAARRAAGRPLGQGLG